MAGAWDFLPPFSFWAAVISCLLRSASSSAFFFARASASFFSASSWRSFSSSALFCWVSFFSCSILTSFSCPESEGFFPNLSDCSSFYQCVSWSPYKQVCPAGLLYNYEGQVCDWPQHVQCYQDQTPTSSSAISSSSTTSSSTSSAIP